MTFNTASVSLQWIIEMKDREVKLEELSVHVFVVILSWVMKVICTFYILVLIDTQLVFSES